jgi:hypothetical protein
LCVGHKIAELKRDSEVKRQASYFRTFVQLEPAGAARHYRSMARRGALLLFLAAGISSCSLFHRPTPQQKMFDALNRGDGAQASEMWLAMSQKDRMKFNRGEGIAPTVPSQEDVMKKLSDMSPDDMEGQVTIKPPGTGASLLDLPKYAGPQGGAAPPAAAPETSGESEEQP